MAIQSNTEGVAIQRAVEESQRAGHQQHDLDKYMSLWSDEARIIIGRSEKPGPHDTTLTRQQFEGSRSLRFRAPPMKGMKIQFDETSVKVNNDHATLTHQVTFNASGYVEVVKEQYRLRKTADGWKAYENRWWPIKMGHPDRPLEYTKEVWRAVDRQVDEAKQLGSTDDHVRALMMAFRFPEALDVATEWTNQSPKLAEAWIARGTAAVLSGGPDDAKKSFATALALDPDSGVPEYARNLSETESE